MSTDRDYFGPSEGMQHAQPTGSFVHQMWPRLYVSDGNVLLTLDDYPLGSTAALYGKNVNSRAIVTP